MGVVGRHPGTRLAARRVGVLVEGRGWGLRGGDRPDEGRDAEKRRGSRSGRSRVGQGARFRRQWWIRAGVLFEGRWAQFVADAISDPDSTYMHVCAYV